MTPQTTPRALDGNAYIEFVEQTATGKTRRFHVVNRRSSISLGEVKWFGAWRQYAFFPTTETTGLVFNDDCLRTIALACEDLTHYHRALVAEKRR